MEQRKKTAVNLLVVFMQVPEHIPVNVMKGILVMERVVKARQ